MRLGDSMSGIEQVMAVLLEEDDLRLVHRDWPRKMRLAVCLMPNGDCQLLLFRQEEAGIFAARLRKHLRLRASELCIHPPVHGFPTRQLRYSDQQSLAALLADSPQLVEDATDYSVNFAFALEEGLDPVAFLGVDAEADFEPIPAVVPAASKAVGPVTFASRRKPVPVQTSAPQPRKLTLDLVREAARLVEAAPLADAPVEKLSSPARAAAPLAMPGAAFKPVSDLQEEAAPDAYALREEMNEFVLSNGAGPVLRIEGAARLFLRDDRQLLAIQIGADATAQPGTVRIKTDVLPKSLQATLRAACGAVDVSNEGPFLYVTLPAEATVEPVAPAKVGKSRPSMWKSAKRRAAVRLFALTTVTAAALFVIMGLQPLEALDQAAETGPIDWSQFRLSMQSEN